MDSIQILAPGTLVLVTLNSPREKFWGAVLALGAAGVSLRGIDLQSLENFIQLVKSGEAATAGLVFFPMHRVERIEADDRNGEFPSLAEQFRSKTGLEITGFLTGGKA